MQDVTVKNVCVLCAPDLTLPVPGGNSQNTLVGGSRENSVYLRTSLIPPDYIYIFNTIGIMLNSTPSVIFWTLFHIITPKLTLLFIGVT